MRKKKKLASHAKFERTFFLNDPLVSSWFLAIVL